MEKELKEWQAFIAIIVSFDWIKQFYQHQWMCQIMLMAPNHATLFIVKKVIHVVMSPTDWSWLVVQLFLVACQRDDFITYGTGLKCILKDFINKPLEHNYFERTHFSSTRVRGLSWSHVFKLTNKQNRRQFHTNDSGQTPAALVWLTHISVNSTP